MKKIKLIAWILSLVWILSFSYWAHLRITPSDKVLWYDCVQKFDVILEMNEWEKAITMDLYLDSNMEFVNFENWNLFEYFTPPYDSKWYIKTLLFNTPWWEIVKWWRVASVYYKVKAEQPYLTFKFLWAWEPWWTNLNIWWINILSTIAWWKYEIGEDIDCGEYKWWYIDLWDHDAALTKFINKFNDDRGILSLLNPVTLAICVWVVIIILLVCYLLIKKWKRK